VVHKIICDLMEYCCFNGEAFPQFNFIQYTLSYVLVQVAVNVALIQVKLQRKPGPVSYVCVCECSLTVICGKELITYCLLLVLEHRPRLSTQLCFCSHFHFLPASDIFQVVLSSWLCGVHCGVCLAVLSSFFSFSILF